MSPLTPDDLVPSTGIEPVTLKIWAEAHEDGSLRFVLSVPQSQVGSASEALGRHLAATVAALFVDEGVPFETAQGKVH